MTLDYPAVLDMKWSTSLTLPGGRPVLAAADAAGRVGLLSLEDGTDLKCLSELKVTEGESLALSLDWNDRRQSGESGDRDHRLATSDSGGNIHVVAVDRSGGLDRTYSAKRHEFEAWICCFDCFDDNVVFSGGDDCRLCCSDVRVDQPVFSLRQGHSAGVTSLLSCAWKQHTLYSGRSDRNYTQLLETSCTDLEAV